MSKNARALRRVAEAPQKAPSQGRARVVHRPATRRRFAFDGHLRCQLPADAHQGSAHEGSRLLQRHESCTDEPRQCGALAVRLQPSGWSDLGSALVLPGHECPHDPLVHALLAQGPGLSSRSSPAWARSSSRASRSPRRRAGRPAPRCDGSSRQCPPRMARTAPR